VSARWLEVVVVPSPPPPHPPPGLPSWSGEHLPFHSCMIGPAAKRCGLCQTCGEEGLEHAGQHRFMYQYSMILCDNVATLAIIKRRGSRLEQIRFVRGAFRPQRITTIWALPWDVI
jgi:hypothetical protein